MSEKNLKKQISGERVSLRFPKVKDADEFILESNKSLEFHTNLVNPAKDFDGYKQFLEKSNAESNCYFLITRNEDKKLIGVINMSQIFYGGFKNCYLGYYLFDGFTGLGYMTEALILTLKFAFGDLKLHRMEANIQPQNFASIELVKRCGFTKEGYSRKYLKIDGKWCDHERWAIIEEDWLENKN